MMPRLLADENFNGSIVRGLLRRIPDLDLLTVQQVGQSGASDPDVLEWAAQAGRILLTHDVNTIPAFVRKRVTAGRPMPGVIVVPSVVPIGRVIEDLLLLVQCSEEGEWENQIVRVPL
jgi:predicted nuclease of predicted toxin-antitoxin system